MSDVAASSAREKLFSRDYLLVCLTFGTLFASFYFLLPTLPLYVKELGSGDFEVGLMMAVLTLGSIGSRLALGPAVNRWGGQSVLKAGTIIFLLSMGAIGLANTVPSLLLQRLIQGIGFGAVVGSTASLVADLAPVSRRGEAVGYYGVASLLAMAFIPGVAIVFLGLELFQLRGFALVFAAATAVAVVAVVLALSISAPKGQPPLASKSSGFFAWEVLPIALALLLITPTFGALITFVPLYTGANTAAFFFVYAAAMIVFRPLSGIASDRLGRRRVLIPTIALTGVGMALLAVSAELPVVVAAAVVYAAGFGGVYPGLMALGFDTARPERRGAAVGTLTAAFDMGIVIGVIGVGAIAEKLGYSSSFLISAGVAVVALIYFWLIFPRLTGDTAAASVREP